MLTISSIFIPTSGEFFHERPTGNIARQAEPAPKLWVENESAKNYENLIWELVSWKTEFQNDFYEKLFLGTSFMKNRFWESIYEKLNLKMRFREKLKNYNFLRKYVKKQTFRKMTNRNLNSKKVENTLFREFFIKYSQIPDFEKKRKQEKLLQKHQIMVTIARENKQISSNSIFLAIIPSRKWTPKTKSRTYPPFFVGCVGHWSYIRRKMSGLWVH